MDSQRERHCDNTQCALNLMRIRYWTILMRSAWAFSAGNLSGLLNKHNNMDF